MKVGALSLCKPMQPRTSGYLLAAWHRKSSITWTWSLCWHPAQNSNKRWSIGRFRLKLFALTMGALGSIHFNWQGYMKNTPDLRKPSEFMRSIDAQVWAKAFVAHAKHYGKDYPLDEGTMFGWFANAIMAGYDEAERRKMSALFHPASDIGNQYLN